MAQSEAQKRAQERYAKTIQGKKALARADRKRRDSPERIAYLATKMREYRSRIRAARSQELV